jgi:hypothetical protein
MPTLHATAAAALAPTEEPVSRPRRVSVTGVKGWYLANCSSPVGRVATRTKPLPRNGRRVRNIGVLLAVSTLLAARPSAVASQIRAKAKSTSTPTAASQLFPPQIVPVISGGQRHDVGRDTTIVLSGPMNAAEIERLEPR